MKLRTLIVDFDCEYGDNHFNLELCEPCANRQKMWWGESGDSWVFSQDNSAGSFNLEWNSGGGTISMTTISTSASTSDVYKSLESDWISYSRHSDEEQ